MAPRPRFATLDEEKRAAILAAAAAELGRAGFEAASYNRIMKEAGVSKGAMYYYFDDKEDLFLTTLNEAITRLVVGIGHLPPFEDARGFWCAITDLYRRVFAFFEQEPVLFGLARAVLGVPPGSRAAELLDRFITRGVNWFRGVLEGGQQLGAVRSDVDGELLARLMFATGEAADRWLIERFSTLSPEVIERLPELLVGLQVRLAAPLSLVVALESERAPKKPAHPKRRKR